MRAEYLNKKKAGRPKGSVGRPNKKIDWDAIDKMLIAGCQGTSIAHKYGMNPETFYRRCQKEKGINFSEYQQQKLEVGNDILRQVQFSKAAKGDNTMLVWLGKNRVGQTDKVESKVQAQIESKVEVSQKAILELPDNDNRNPNRAEEV